MAALLHDIGLGHLIGMKYSGTGEFKFMGLLGVVGHEKIGAQILRKAGFSEKVRYEINRLYYFKLVL